MKQVHKNDIFDALLELHRDNNFFLPTPLAHYAPTLTPYLSFKEARYMNLKLTHLPELMNDFSLEHAFRVAIDSYSIQSKLGNDSSSKEVKKILNLINKNYLPTSIEGKVNLLIHFKIVIEKIEQLIMRLGSPIRQQEIKDTSSASYTKEEKEKIGALANAKISIMGSVIDELEKVHLRHLFKEASEQSEMYTKYIAYLLASKSFEFNKEQLFSLTERAQDKNCFLNRYTRHLTVISAILHTLCLCDEILIAYSPSEISLSFNEHIQTLSSALENKNCSAIKQSFKEKYFINKGPKTPNLSNVENVLLLAQFNLWEKKSINCFSDKIDPLPLLMMVDADTAFFNQIIDAVKSLYPGIYKSLDYCLALSSLNHLHSSLPTDMLRNYEGMVALFEPVVQREILEKGVSKAHPLEASRLGYKI